ncbi:hypothetical protein BSPWISOXPB_617 [uncultured Gammaproteobacteria bacterium]|nr:hypothetical protein BSPWISOXPB_617 [uncultured Gammaproteobacteria bacterium]
MGQKQLIEKIYANYIEKIYANSDLDSVFTKTLECLGGITIKSLSDIENIKLK